MSLDTYRRRKNEKDTFKKDTFNLLKTTVHGRQGCYYVVCYSISSRAWISSYCLSVQNVQRDMSVSISIYALCEWVTRKENCSTLRFVSKTNQQGAYSD